MLKNFSRISVLAVTLFITGCASTLSPQSDLAKQPQVNEFITQMSNEYQYDPAVLQQAFAAAKIDPHVIQLMTKPHEGKPWYEYRKIFIQPERVQAGVAFWHEHAATLAYAEKQYGVPAEIIVAILGVETHFGKNEGNINTLDALSTLAFAYPPRAHYFRTELEQYFLLARDLNVDPTSIKGSYAGALGYPQFMPSSYRQYAVSYQHNGYSNLFTNADDAIVSIANYFHHFGWQYGEQITVPAQGPYQQHLSLSAQGIKSERSVNDWQRIGYHSPHNLPSNTSARLVTLEGTNERAEYWLALHNFSVIMKYNTSPLYAMAVYQLSQQIKAYENA